MLRQEHLLAAGVSRDGSGAQEDPMHKAASEAQAKLDAYREEGQSRLEECLDPSGGIPMDSAGTAPPPPTP